MVIEIEMIKEMLYYMEQYLPATTTDLISEAIVLNNNLIPKAMTYEDVVKTKVIALKGAAIYLTVAYRLHIASEKLA